MTITRRLGIGYGLMAVVCVLVLIWLWYHEFIAEPAEYAALGLGNLHQDTAAEFYAVCFLAVIPLLLGVGWWWARRVLAPLQALMLAAEKIESDNLRRPLPRSMNDDEVDRLAAVLTSMTARLDASFRQIREFTLHASHELKTPLTILRAQLETVLHESRTLSPEQREWLGGLLDEVQRLAKIVDSLTLLTKADAGLIALERRPVRFDELVREAFDDALLLAQSQRLHVSLDECIGTVLNGDRHRLRQLLLILVDNAVKYNQPGGEIHIVLREHEGDAELRIANDGAGVSAETQQRIFGRFVRGDNTTGVDGSGLGLNIAQWIVRAHGGSIQLRSEPGGKTTVIVRLPLAEIRAPEAVPEATHV